MAKSLSHQEPEICTFEIRSKRRAVVFSLLSDRSAWYLGDEQEKQCEDTTFLRLTRTQQRSLVTGGGTVTQIVHRWISSAKSSPKVTISKQPIRTPYLGHVTGYQPIRDQYFLIWSVPGNDIRGRSDLTSIIL
eukprot:sb/3474876/